MSTELLSRGVEIWTLFTIPCYFSPTDSLVGLDNCHWEWKKKRERFRYFILKLYLQDEGHSNLKQHFCKIELFSSVQFQNESTA